jgi:hypothetical protein
VTIRTTLMLVLAGIAVPVLAQSRQGTQPPLGTPMPYTAIHQPEFFAASEASFLQDDDVLLDARGPAVLKGKVLRFQAANDDASSLIDLETRSTWNASGLCLEGQLKGTQLKQVILVPQFWFAWSQFHQGTRVFTTR